MREKGYTRKQRLHVGQVGGSQFAPLVAVFNMNGTACVWDMAIDLWKPNPWNFASSCFISLARGQLLTSQKGKSCGICLCLSLTSLFTILWHFFACKRTTERLTGQQIQQDDLGHPESIPLSSSDFCTLAMQLTFSCLIACALVMDLHIHLSTPGFFNLFGTATHCSHPI